MRSWGRTKRQSPDAGSMKKGVTWDELIDYWKRELWAAASEMTWRAASSCRFASDVYLGENHSDRAFLIHPAFVIHLEHPDEAIGAECVACPYQGSRGGKITLGEPTRTVAGRWMLNVNPASHPEH